VDSKLSKALHRASVIDKFLHTLDRIGLKGAKTMWMSIFDRPEECSVDSVWNLWYGSDL